MHQLTAVALYCAVISVTSGCSFDTSGTSPADDQGSMDQHLLIDLQTNFDRAVDDAARDGSLPVVDGAPDLQGIQDLQTVVDGPADSAIDGPPAPDGPVFLDGPVPDGPSTPWWDVSWLRRRKLTFNNGSRAQDLGNFPVLVKLNNSRIDYNVMDPAGTGKDLRFVDQDHTTVLAHQIEQWSAGGTSHVWVRVPQIDKSSATDHIWLYYGNKNAPDGQNASGVWAASFAGVYHLASDVQDSTSNNNDASNHGSTQQSGWLAGGRFFDGNNDYIELPNSSGLTLSVHTVELWFRSSQTWDQPYFPASATLISRATPGCNTNDWAILGGHNDSESGNAGRVLVGVGIPPDSCDSRFTSNTQKNDGKPHYLAWTRTAAGMNRLYIDGNQETTFSDSGGNIAANRPLQVGGEQYHSGGSFLQGMIDEVRISNVVRSPLWIDAQHASMTDALIIYEPEQSP